MKNVIQRVHMNMRNYKNVDQVRIDRFFFFCFVLFFFCFFFLLFVILLIMKITDTCTFFGGNKNASYVI